MSNWGSELSDSLTLGVELVLPTLLGAVVGYYADQYFSSAPLGMIVGVFVGAGLGFWRIVVKFLAGPKEKEKR